MSAPKLELLVLSGSQYVAKVVTAFDWAGVPYVKRQIDFGKLKQQVPPPHQVPYMFFTLEGKEPEGLPGSDNILRWVDENVGLERKFFPREFADAAGEVERLADDLNDYVLWFNWVHDEGFARTLGAAVKKKVGFLSFIVTPLVLGGTRKKMKAKVQEHKPEVVDDDKAIKGLLEACGALEARLTADSPASLVQGCPTPTGGDFAVYSMLSRFVTPMGDAALGETGALPNLWELSKTEKLKDWFGRMERDHPIRFKDPKSDKGKK
jgi:hypothetical protein